MRRPRSSPPRRYRRHPRNDASDFLPVEETQTYPLYVKIKRLAQVENDAVPDQACQIGAPVADDSIEGVQGAESKHKKMDLRAWPGALNQKEVVDQNLDCPWKGERNQIPDNAANSRQTQETAIRTDEPEKPFQGSASRVRRAWRVLG